MKTRHTPRRTGTRRTEESATADTMRDEIVDWLRDAYAMERSLEAALQKQANDDELSATTRQRAAQHLEETRRHAEAVQSALGLLGTDTSALKTTMGRTLQATKSMTMKFAADERIKNLLDAYAMEHFEIACYTALAVAAEGAGLNQVAEICRGIIPDEERMAQTLRQALPGEVASYLTEAETSEAWSGREEARGER